MNQSTFGTTFRVAALCGGCWLLAGCALSGYGPRHDLADARPGENSRGYASEAITRSADSPAEENNSEQVESYDLGRVLTELEAIGDIDPQLKQELISDLRETPPAMWDATIQVYRSALAYRQQQVDRNEQSNPEQALARLLKKEASKENLALAKSDGPQRDRGAPTPAQSESASTVAVDDAGQNARAIAASQAAHVQQESEEKPSRVQTAAGERDLVERAPVDWRAELQKAIRLLEQEANGPAHDDADARARAILRMLYLAADRNHDALSPIEGLPAAQQEYWAKQLYALSTYLDDRPGGDSTQRAAEARRYLDEAASQLAELSMLSVRNLAFCTEVKSYGVYQQFKSYEFTPGQEVLLYAEIENFKSEASEKGYHTSLRSSYEIYDSRGARVDDHDFDVTEEYCQNARHDFFMRYFIWMPKRAYDGRYTLKLTIEDLLSKKVGQASIDFEIKSGDK